MKDKRTRLALRELGLREIGMSWKRLALPAMSMIVAAVGCAHPTVCRHDYAADSATGYELPSAERTPIVGHVDLAATAGLGGQHSAAADDALPTVSYQSLTARESQCLAVEASVIGNLLDRERANCSSCSLGHADRQTQCTQLEVLRHAGAEARNKSGADAMKLFYGIAATEAGLDSVAAAMTVLDDVTSKLDQIRSEELTVPVETTQFDRQRLELIAKRADLEATRATLNAQLRALLSLDSPGGRTLLQPEDSWEITTTSFDVEAEVAYGLATRPELALLRRLTMADEESTAAAAKALLGDVHGLMGIAARAMTTELLNSVLGVTGCEAAVRRRQIRELHDRRSQQLAGEIRAAVLVIEARRRQAQAAQGQVLSRLKRVDELRQRRETADATFVEMGESQLRLTEERAAVTSAVIAWKRAVVDLRELQGAIVAECRGGESPPSTPMPSTSERSPNEVGPIPSEVLPPILRSAHDDGAI